VGEASIDSAFVIQSLHHFHRRDEVFRVLGKVVRPGGRLFLVEPHHNLRRVARLTRKYLAEYRATSFWQDERNWATHDFLTRGELRSLCRQGGFTDVTLEGYWIPGSRRLIVDPRRRFELERVMGRLPAVRHFAMVLALTARREGDRSG
jgi:SAM-dependent methyltransferase